MAGTRPHAMIGGDGGNSYIQNSTFQRNMFALVKGTLEETINTKFDISKKTAIRIVDLGCSVGPNTFYTVELITEAISSLLKRAPSNGAEDLEFHVFFNDQIGNDFNMLFNTMPPGRRYFTAAVPGSFYSRLFPRDSIHFFNSSMALHWLSRAPPGVANKGRVYIYGGGPVVLDAYVAQFRADVAAFLDLRAEELAGGGLMTILFICRHESMDLSTTEIAWPVGYLDPILRELQDEGKVKEEDLDSFQVPIYTPTVEEFKALVEMDGRYLVHVAKTVDEAPKVNQTGENGPVPDFGQIVQGIARASRAVFGKLIQAHFGEEIVEEIYERFTTKIYQELIASRSLPNASPPTALFILERKHG